MIFQGSDQTSLKDEDEKLSETTRSKVTNLRWVVLTLAIFYETAPYFCYDNPTPLKSKLMADPFDLTESQYNDLFSIYAFPNMILPLLGGVFMDKLGIRVGMPLFVAILSVG